MLPSARLPSIMPYSAVTARLPFIAHYIALQRVLALLLLETMPDQQMATPEEILARAIAQFNGWRFWECHETLEDIWRAEESDLADLYQGVIKLAAGFHHLLRGNHNGAVIVLRGALPLLDPFRPACLGINVQRLIAEASECLRHLEELGPERLGEFDRALIPAIHVAAENPREARSQ